MTHDDAFGRDPPFSTMPRADDPVAEIAAFAARVRIEPSGALKIDGRAVETSHRRVGLAERLAVCLYEQVYTRAGRTDATASRHDLIGALAAANTTRTRWEDDWTLVDSDRDGSVTATRHGRMRRFGPGEFLLEPGAPNGTRRLGVHIAGGSATRQPGFYHCFSESFRDSNDQRPLARLYLHTRAEQAPGLLSHLTRVLNRYRVPFLLKMATRVADYARADNTVLYVVRDSVHVVLHILSESEAAIAPCLTPSVPLMTLPLTSGIGLADDPGPGESFGSARCKLAAGAMIAAAEDGCIRAERFSACFDAAVAAAGLRRDALYLEPGADDVFAGLAGLFSGWTR